MTWTNRHSTLKGNKSACWSDLQPIRSEYSNKSDVTTAWLSLTTNLKVIASLFSPQKEHFSYTQFLITLEGIFPQLLQKSTPNRISGINISSKICRYKCSIRLRENLEVWKILFGGTSGQPICSKFENSVSHLILINIRQVASLYSKQWEHFRGVV